jgi:hypothetical protein
MFKTSKQSMKLSREYLDCDLSFFEATTSHFEKNKDDEVEMEEIFKKAL